MRNRIATLRVSLLAVGLCSALTAPIMVQAQGQPLPDPSRQPISVKLENADIRLALQQLFKAAKVSYTVDEAVKGTVTASFEQTPFRLALETLLQSAPTPLTYRFENGIYTILPRSKEEAPQPRPMMTSLHPGYTTATAIVQKLKALPQFGPTSGITYQVNAADNSLLVFTANEDQYRDIKEVVHLLDVPTREVAVKAEVVLTLGGKGGKNPKAVVAMQGRTASEGAVKLQMTTEGKPFNDSPIVLSAGDYDVTLKPTVNGDGTIQVEAEVVLDLTYRLPGDAKSQHLRQKFTGSGRYLSGDTMLLASTVLKSQSGKSSANDAELLIYITPDLIQPRTPQNPGNPGGVRPTPVSTKSGGKRESVTAPPTRKE